MANRENQKLILSPKGKVSSAAERISVTALSQGDKVAILADKISQCQNELSSLVVGSLKKAIEIGKALNEVRQLLPSGTYLAWIDEQLTPACGIRRRTAQRYTRLANNESQILQAIQAESSAANLSGCRELAALRIEDATRLLISGSNDGESGPAKPGALANAFPAEFQESLHRLLKASSDSAATIPLIELPCDPKQIRFSDNRHAYVVVRNSKSNRRAVGQLIELYRTGKLTAAFLWISSHSLSQWLPHLNQFPRVCVRDQRYGQNPWWLCGLMSDALVPAFADEFFPLGDVLVPYSPSTDSSETLPE